MVRSVSFPGVEFDTTETLAVFIEHYADMYDRGMVVAGDSIVTTPMGTIGFKAEKLATWLVNGLDMVGVIMNTHSAEDRWLRQRLYKDSGTSLCCYWEVFGDSE